MINHDKPTILGILDGTLRKLRNFAWIQRCASASSALMRSAASTTRSFFTWAVEAKNGGVQRDLKGEIHRIL